MDELVNTVIRRLRVSELGKPQHRWIFISVFVIFAAFYAARMANSVISYLLSRKIQAEVRLSQDSSYALPSQPLSARDYASIVIRNIFDSKAKDKLINSLEDSDIVNAEKAIKSSLDVKLIGTAVFSVPQMSVCVVQDRAAQAIQIAHIGESIKDALLVKVERLKILLQRNGRLEFIESEERPLPFRTAGDVTTSLAPPAGVPPPPAPPPSSDDGIKWESDGKAVIRQAEVEAALQNMSQVITQARVVPNLTADNKQDGFKIFAIKSGSIYSRIGLKDGDVLKRINGQDLNSIEQGMQLFSALRNEKSISIDLVRDGQKRSFFFEIR